MWLCCVTVSGIVIFTATLLATPNSSRARLGSGVITDLALSRLSYLLNFHAVCLPCLSVFLWSLLMDSRFVFVYWLISYRVVHQSSHIVLQASCMLINGSLMSTFFHLSFKQVIFLDDRLIAISQIIFWSHTNTHNDSWKNWRWCHC